MDNKIAYLSLVACLGWLPAFSVATTSNVLLAALSDIWIECGDALCRNDTQVCREDSYCECRPHFEDLGSQDCSPCPSEGQLCRGCCISDALTCYRSVCQRCSVDSNGNCINQETLFFLTAAQVALATAMVLGVISLSFLLYKTLRNRLRRNNQVLQNESRQSVVSRVSLSSIQQRVVRRLRDRPPKYETRHNYEHQQRQTERQNSQQNEPTETIRHDSVPIGGPPPAYEGDTLSLAENPPPYTQEQTGESSARIAVIEIPSNDQPSDTNEASCDTRSLQGITNQVFEPDKLDPATHTFQPPGSGENNRRPKECIDIPLGDSGDKTVYM
uniref:TNFR-Cys domain-containing protein n=1 Tax=Anopheles atroparvus TaxID=41427 RepID=A0AAG5CP42_ANOAO